MASKVKDTPVLTGKNAERFDRILKENATKKVSAANYNRAKETYQRITLK